MTDDLEQRRALAREALSWLGTPHHHGQRVKGAGVDCALFLAEVYERCGLVGRIEPGYYPHDWHLNHTDELFAQWLRRAGAREVEAPRLGDVGLWKFGLTRSHGSIVVADDGQMAHAYLRRGVILTRPDEEPLSGRAVTWWSVFA